MHTGLAQTQFLHAVNANLWNANFTSSMRKTTFGILSNLNSGAKHFLMGRLPSRAVQHHQIWDTQNKFETSSQARRLFELVQKIDTIESWQT